MEETTENFDSTNETVEETVETPAETTEETLETPIDIEQLQATNKKLYERAKKAEAEAKALRGSGSPAPQPNNVEETVLLANGMPEELLNELKVVAQVRKTTLIKAQNDPIFIAVKDKFEKDLKSKAASLPASRGAGGTKVQKTFNTPNLSRDEHRKMVLG